MADACVGLNRGDCFDFVDVAGGWTTISSPARFRAPCVRFPFGMFCRSVSTASHSVCSNFLSTCLVSGRLLWRRLFSPESTGLRHGSPLSVRLHQPSSCQLHSRQSALHRRDRDASHVHGQRRQYAADRWRRRWLAPVSCSRRAHRFPRPPAQLEGRIRCRDARPTRRNGERAQRVRPAPWRQNVWRRH